MPGPETHVYSPSELNNEARRHIEAGFGRVWVQGEVSNLATPSSGHRYFTLKDGQGQLRCALFKNAGSKVSAAFRSGDEVLVQGQLSLYAPRGDYQLIASVVLNAGLGALHAEFERLKKQLEAEGLFDPRNKKPLPQWPMNIAVVTSSSGAALKDIQQTLARRWPMAKLILYPSSVQGQAAPEELIQAITEADKEPSNDLIILARGGGSLEDLWAFNDERLARVISAVSHPVVSGVGHETDTTIVDFVADCRAPTPTGAVVIATPDIVAVQDHVHKYQARLLRCLSQKLTLNAQMLDLLERRLRALHPEAVLTRAHERLDGLSHRMVLAYKRLVHSKTQAIESLARSLNGLSPLNVLQRGYAFATDEKDRTFDKDNPPKLGDLLRVRLSDFEIQSTVTDVKRVTRSEESMPSGSKTKDG